MVPFSVVSSPISSVTGTSLPRSGEISSGAGFSWSSNCDAYLDGLVPALAALLPVPAAGCEPADFDEVPVVDCLSKMEVSIFGAIGISKVPDGVVFSLLAATDQA